MLRRTGVRPDSMDRMRAHVCTSANAAAVQGVSTAGRQAVPSLALLAAGETLICGELASAGCACQVRSVMYTDD